MANITVQTINKLKQLGVGVSFCDGNYNEVSIQAAILLVTSIDTEETGFFVKTLKAPKKKEITIEWVMSKMCEDTSYKNLTKLFSKIIKTNNANVYPTTYGFGFFSLLGRDDETKEKLASILNEANIKYKSELSEAGWVYRFVISKSKKNIENINALLVK